MRYEIYFEIYLLTSSGIASLSVVDDTVVIYRADRQAVEEVTPVLIPTPGIRPDGERPSSGAPGPGGERAARGVSLLEGAEWVRGGFARRGWIWDYTELPDTEPGSAGAGLDYEALREALAASRMPDGRDAELDERIAAVQEGRLEPCDLARIAALAVEHMEPGPAQAGWLDVATAARELLDENELTGTAIASRQLASWAAASELAAVAQIASRAAAADSKIGVAANLRPARVCRDAVGQVEMALTLTHYGAEEWADLAVTLAWRLPATGQALAAGFIDAYRARLIADATSVLSEEDARRVEERVLHCAGRRTYADLRERLARAVIAVDPEGAERRRQAAEGHADVRLYADDDQTATISATKLPQIQAAAGFARLDALARARKAAGLPGSLGFHRSQVLLGMMHDTLPYIPPADGAPPDQPPPGNDGPEDDDPGTDHRAGPAGDGGHGSSGPVDDGLDSGVGPADDSALSDPGPDGPDGPAASEEGGPGDIDPGDNHPGDTNPGVDYPADSYPGDGDPGVDDPCYGGPGGMGPADSGTADRGDIGSGGPRGNTDAGSGGPRGDGDAGPNRGPSVGGGVDDAPASDGPWDGPPAPRDEDAPRDDGLDGLEDGAGVSWDPSEEDDDPCGTGPAPAWPALGVIPPGLARRDPGPPADGRPVPGLLDVTLPWTTLRGLGQEPGTLGRIGPITGVQARQLARAAEADPGAQWRVIVTTPAGQAIAVSRVRRPRGRGGGARDRPPGPAPPGAGLVGRVTVTISQDIVTDSQQEASGPGPPSGMAAAAQAAAARALDKARAQAEVDAAAGGCSHHDQSAAYRPPPRLREYVTARDLTCRNPVCRQPAWRADLDHTKPWAPGGTGGPTCQCNLGGRCRRDHILKQHPRWGFAQDGGEFTWTAPSGRRYTVSPDTHPV